MSRKIEKFITLLGLVCCIALAESKEDMATTNEISNKVLDENLSLIRNIKKDIENQYYLINAIAENLNSDIPNIHGQVLKNKLDRLISREFSSEVNTGENFGDRQNFMKRFDWFKRNMYTSRYSKIPVIRTG